MQVWFSEDQTDDLRISVRVRSVLRRERSPYQEIMVLDTFELGRMLILDDVIQTNERTEFVYHEMMAHVPLFAHPQPRRVLVVGGGDGGVVREVVKHPCVEEVVLVEIDERVTAAARELLPSLSSGLSDPRVKIRFEDGIEHVAASPRTYDVIIIDSTDPIGPAVGLFQADFYRSVSDALRDGGLFVAQTESPFYEADLIRGVQRDLRRIFPRAALYVCAVPEYPGGLWTISLGSKGPDPQEVPAERYREREFAGFGTAYYTPEIHRAAFALPPFITDMIAEADGFDEEPPARGNTRAGEAHPEPERR